MAKRLTDEERAELIAYLDGEASGDAKRAIEAKLSLDPAWRAEAESFKRTWDLLDFLPRSEPKADFTARTMSRLEPIRRPVTNQAVRRRVPRWAVAGAWAASLLLAALAGYAACRALTSGQGEPHTPGEAELVRDLRIIESKRQYDAIDDFEFLQELDEPDLFGEDAVGG
jgi:anti-sigma factor RsiW